MKSVRIIMLLTFVFVSMHAFAGGMDKLKSLVGEWEGKTKDGKPASVKYELISSGTAVMESLAMPDGANMVSIYHMNGDKIMMTHYCAMNNQPRFEASGSDNTLTFNYVDATNLPDTSAPHIHGLVLKFKDADHFTQEWSSKGMKGESEEHMIVDFQRKK